MKARDAVRSGSEKGATAASPPRRRARAAEPESEEESEEEEEDDDDEEQEEDNVEEASGSSQLARRKRKLPISWLRLAILGFAALLMIGQVSPAAPGSPPDTSGVPSSLFAFIVAGGWIGVVIILLSFVGLGLVCTPEF